MHWSLAIVLPLAAAVVWGAFAAPKARWPSTVGRLVVEVLVFAAATAALWAVGRPGLAVAFALIAIADGIAVRVFALPAVDELSRSRDGV